MAVAAGVVAEAAVVAADASEAIVVADTASAEALPTNLIQQAETSFEDLGLPTEIVDVLTRQNITVPTPIQLRAIPDVLAGRDVCGRAETGSGKTLAFGLPLLVRLERNGRRGPTAIVLVPTRELAAQVTEALELSAATRGINLVAVYGGMPIKSQISSVKRGADVLVATPGRLLDLQRRRVVSLEDVTTVVIDEADQMADMGFLPQVHDVLRTIPRGHQTMLFSATLDGQVTSLIRDYMTDPVTHEVDGSAVVGPAQEHRFIGVHPMDKAKVAAVIINGARRSLVFVRTKRGADRVAGQLADEGIRVAKTHGDLPQHHRQRSLEQFVDGKVQALVATNVAARGLHIDDVDVVVHYDPPDDYKTFVHRSGRTARAGEEGLVVTLVEWDETLEVERLQRSVGLNSEIVKMYSNDPRLEDLVAFQPSAAAFRKKTVADFSRRAGRRR
ncbi:MAG TPA: DEAD/DEAH box helicase [Acidimicrobiia bacterium]|nr:DEAD/DEAH box helicase [Acidimicrobiia bacterium]